MVEPVKDDITLLLSESKLIVVVSPPPVANRLTHSTLSSRAKDKHHIALLLAVKVGTPTPSSVA